MKRRTLLLSLPLLAAALLRPAVAAEAPLPVVASFTILADLVRAVGGERVRVATLVGPDGDAHVYQPTPADAKAVAAARLVVVNGLGFEGWMERLVKASGFAGTLVTASAGVVPRTMEEEEHEGHGDREEGHHHEGLDPHAWQDLKNGMTYVRNIAAALAEADPAHAGEYRERAAAYLGRLETLDREVRDRLGALPPERRRLITSHDAFGYFAAAYGLTILAPTGVSTDAEASAAEVAALIRQVRAEKIKAVFVENVTDPRLIERIAAETGAAMGGTLYTDALSGSKGSAPSYLEMFRYNLRTLLKALTATEAGRA